MPLRGPGQNQRAPGPGRLLRCVIEAEVLCLFTAATTKQTVFCQRIQRNSRGRRVTGREREGGEPFCCAARFVVCARMRLRPPLSVRELRHAPVLLCPLPTRRRPRRRRVFAALLCARFPRVSGAIARGLSRRLTRGIPIP